jgi:nitrosocyanin
MEPNTTPQNNNNALLIGGLLIAVAIIAGAVIIANNNKTETAVTVETAQEDTISVSPSASNTASPTTTGTGTTTVTPEVTGEVKVVNIEAGAFYYKPNEIRVKKGEKVKIVLKSVDMMHDFNIDELGVKAPITKAGETATVEFIANKVGEYEYYCSVGKHRQNGQVGKLIVE